MSQLQARRDDFAKWAGARSIAPGSDEWQRSWVIFSGGWEACADRVWGKLEQALGSIRPEGTGPSGEKE